MTNQEYADALRRMAAFFESHKDVPNPGEQKFNIYLEGDALRETARLIGTCEKNFDDTYFTLHRNFGGLIVEWFTFRTEICEKVSKGTKIIPKTIIPARPEEVIEEHEEEIFEWHCPESLLSEAQP